MRHKSSRIFKLLGGGVTLALAAAGMSVAIAAPASAADCTAVAWMDQSKSAEERAAALLSASTQEQKYRWLNEQSANSPAQTTFGAVTYPAQVECTPTVVYTDGPDGVRFTAGVTAFPAPIAMASTWNLDLATAKGAAQGAESFDKGKNGVLGPGMASGRTPLSGRTPEYFGEDSLLSGLLGASTVKGLEEGNADKPVMADLKHFVANEQELDRNASSSNVDERTLYEVYDLPFKIAVAESSPSSVMCSYNQINGAYACENTILNDVLKGQGFDGYVMSDFRAVHSTAQSLMNGLDQELNAPVYFTPALLTAALTAGQITQARIDEAAARVVTAYIRAGLFDHPLPATPVPDASTDAHKAIALETAQQGTVLLKNDGALPLKAKKNLKIALFGPTASSTPTNGISASSVCSMVWRFGGGGTLNCEDLVAPEVAITQRAAQAGATVTFNAGTDLATVATDAAAADVSIVFGYQRMGEFNDVADLHLQGGGDALIDAVAAAGKKTVVVLNTGSAVEMPWIDSVDGVFESWFGGEQFGPAIAGLLFGDVNPSGKLPMTFPKSLADVPTQTPAQYPGVFSDGSTTRPAGSTEIRQVSYSEGLQVGYKWYDEQNIDPLFEFGHGLSYTSFKYSKPNLSSQVDRATGTVKATLSFTMKNSGKKAGAEIPQVYLTLPDSAGEPGKRLVGFDRVSLTPGQSTRVAVELDSTSSNQPFSVWNADADAWQIPSGTFGISVGSSSRDIELEKLLKIDLVSPIHTHTVAKADRLIQRANAPVTIAVAVTAGKAAPVGTVTITDHGKPVATAALTAAAGGKVAIKLPPLKKGLHLLDVTFAGTGFATSSSRPVPVLAF